MVIGHIGLIPDWGTKIPHAVREKYFLKKKKKEIF